jgi:hypothetical protein
LVQHVASGAEEATMARTDLRKHEFARDDATGETTVDGDACDRVPLSFVS